MLLAMGMELVASQAWGKLESELVPSAFRFLSLMWTTILPCGNRKKNAILNLVAQGLVLMAGLFFFLRPS